MLAVCHDAGGAEMVSSYLRRQRLPATCVLGGPAVPVFERKLGHALPSPDLEEAVRKLYGFQIRDHVLEMFGLCRACAAEE